MSDSNEPKASLPQATPTEGASPCAGCGGGDRRQFMFKVGLGLMGAGGAAATVPVVSAMLGPGLRRYPEQWVDLGPISLYPPGETRFATFVNPWTSPTDGLTADTGCWVRHVPPGETGDRAKAQPMDTTSGDPPPSNAFNPQAPDFQVFAVNCAHLGCPVRWFPQSRLFMCPCHGGVYYEDGSRASGPPPRSLFPYPAKIENGHLWIDAGRLPGLQEAP
ncbi:MAG: ubiquinol-cytochrome c reductase iron-sulfur subunit [Phycisphaerales bacterium]